MSAVYDLTRMPSTYDFSSWCCYARTMGEEHVHFIIDGPIAAWKYPAEVAWQRFGTMMVPMTKLAGLAYSVGERKSGNEYPYLAGALNALYKQTGRIEKLKPTRKAESLGHVTITLRESFRNKYRNSNLAAWMKFEKYLQSNGEQVVVFPECEHAPINLEYRMSMYAAASMNMGIANGPMSLCLYSEAPYISLNQTPEVPTGEKAQYDQVKLLHAQGFPPGSQFAFRNKRQVLVYETDEYENIVRHYNGMMERAAA